MTQLHLQTKLVTLEAELRSQTLMLIAAGKFGSLEFIRTQAQKADDLDDQVRAARMQLAA